jgi:hypothetical protein
MALFVNGSLVLGTVYGSGAGTQQNTGQALINIPAGGVLTVRNHTSSAAVGLASTIGGRKRTRTPLSLSRRWIAGVRTKAAFTR